MTSSLRRRQVLGGVAAVLSATVAGCEGHSPSLEMRETSDSGLRSDAVRSVSSDTTADRLRPIVETIENGTNELQKNELHSYDPRPPVYPAEPAVAPFVGRPIEYEGTYYALPVTETIERTLTNVEVRIGTGETASDDAPNAVEFGDLPAVDRDALDDELPPVSEDRNAESDDQSYMRRLVYGPQEAEASTLVSGPDYDAIVRDDRRYSITVTGRGEGTGYSYRYEADPVASTDDEFLRWLRSEYRYELTGLPEDEREIVAEAVEEHRYAGSDSDAAFVSLSEQFLSEPALHREDGSGKWFVRYDGSEYIAKLRAPPEFH